MTSFLINKDTIRRLQLQLNAFQSDTYLSVVSSILEIPEFRLPNLFFDRSKVRLLTMPENLRLGNRLERFFSFIIEQSETYDLIAENIQIIKHKITLGELDFIVYDKINNTYIHIELAGKIYLYDPAVNGELARWIGPNRKDSLLKKTAKLQTKQFPLLYDEQTLLLLKNIGVDVAIIQQKICFKARLFLPYKFRDTIPKFIDTKNIMGYYQSLNGFLNLPEYRNYQYFMPLKQDWIVTPVYGEVWFDFDTILPKIEITLLHKQSPMLWVKKPDSEYETIFVVWW